MQYSPGEKNFNHNNLPIVVIPLTVYREIHETLKGTIKVLNFLSIIVVS